MIIRVYEGVRKLVNNASSTTVNFVEVHEKVPVVNVTLEPDNSGGDVDATTTIVESVSTTGATVSFSSNFSGYLHLHAFSA